MFAYICDFVEVEITFHDQFTNLELPIYLHVVPFFLKTVGNSVGNYLKKTQKTQNKETQMPN